MQSESSSRSRSRWLYRSPKRTNKAHVHVYAWAATIRLHTTQVSVGFHRKVPPCPTHCTCSGKDIRFFDENTQKNGIFTFSWDEWVINSRTENLKTFIVNCIASSIEQFSKTQKHTLKVNWVINPNCFNTNSQICSYLHILHLKFAY